MLSWERGGVAPIYLCESHAANIPKDSGFVVAPMPQSVHSDHATEQPQGSVPRSGPGEEQVAVAKKDAAVVTAPLPNLASGDSAKALVNETSGNGAHESVEAYRPALQGVKPSTATEEKQAERADLERLCLSRYGQRCSGDATVHCPKCGRWFCDAHGEDEKWHACALPMPLS